MKNPTLIVALAFCVAIGPTAAGLAAGPYAGQEKRAVSTLSDDDAADLLAGRGWGLAKPAELNGYPGPRHVLDLAGELGLNDAQKNAVAAIYRKMLTAARQTGPRYVAAERALDEAFRSGRADPAVVAARLADAGRLRDRLREIHLVAHLETAPVLSADQRRHYQMLRGYGDDAGHGHSGQGHKGQGHGQGH
jgi:Spy/CpxP family protein refolding chaperone